MVVRCHRCWGSKELEDVFRCVGCYELFCKTHEGLAGLLLCIECFEFNTGGEEDDVCTKKVD